MSELKPCPFCGGEGRVVFGQELHYYVGVCKNCNTHSEPRLTEEYAAESWNRRADDVDAPRARVAELETAQRWIPVTERLPEENRLVQVYNGSVTCGILREPQIIGGGWMIAFDYSGVLEFQFPVTHWMPLPQPPEVK